MATYGRPFLRDLFDGAPTPHIAHPPATHHRDFYLATDGSFRQSGGGLGVDQRPLSQELRGGYRTAGVLLNGDPVPLFQARSLAFDLGQRLVDEAVAGGLAVLPEELPFEVRRRVVAPKVAGAGRDCDADVER